jgi:hypothetical protein
MQPDDRSVLGPERIAPETGFDAKTPRLGSVEIGLGHRLPLHCHTCGEVYSVVRGGEMGSDGVRHPVSVGHAAPNRPNVGHCVDNLDEPIGLVVVAGTMPVLPGPQRPAASPYGVFEASPADRHRTAGEA